MCGTTSAKTVKRTSNFVKFDINCGEIKLFNVRVREKKTSLKFSWNIGNFDSVKREFESENVVYNLITIQLDIYIYECNLEKNSN